MATYNVVQSSHATLVAATVDTVNLSSGATLLIISNRSAASGDIYFRYATNGASAQAPVTLAADSYVVPAGQTRAFTRPNTSQVTQVKLISAGAPDYSVEAF
jgi:hypothetical protein